MIYDSNLIIYSIEQGYEPLSAGIAASARCVSAISEMEVLGYSKLDAASQSKLQVLLSTFRILPVDPKVVQCAIAIRRSCSVGSNWETSLLPPRRSCTT